MFGLTKNKARADEIRADLQSAEADLAAARERVGTAITDADEHAAQAARDEIAQLTTRVGELNAALPIAEQRVREATEREAAQRQADANKAANQSRKKRLAAAKKVDAAMRALCRAHAAHAALDPGGTSDDRLVLARRANSSLQSAMAHEAHPVSLALGVPLVRAAHRRPLAEAEASLISELPE